MLSRFVNDYIRTQGTGASVAVASLFEEARLEKRDVDARFAVLDSIKETTQQYQIPQFEVLDTVSSRTIENSFNLAATGVEDLYRGTNDLSTITFNYATMLTSLIQELDRDLNEVEKLMDSFGGVLASDQGSSFVYIEAFSDSSKQDKQIQSVPDRDGIPFTSFAQVRSDLGIATIPTSSLSVPLTGVQAQVTKANFAISPGDKDLRPALTGYNAQGWRVFYRSSQPFKTGLVPGTVGAQVEIELIYPAPVLANEISFTPAVGIGEQVVSVILHSAGDAANDLELVSDPINLNRTVSIKFTTRVVQRISVIINQPAYKRLIEWVHIEEPAPPPKIIIIPPKVIHAGPNLHLLHLKHLHHLHHLHELHLQHKALHPRAQRVQRRTKVLTCPRGTHIHGRRCVKNTVKALDQSYVVHQTQRAATFSGDDYSFGGGGGARTLL